MSENTLQAEFNNAAANLTADTSKLLSNTAQEIVLQGSIKTECQALIDSAPDASALSGFLVEYINRFFPADSCAGKGNPLATRYRTIKKTLQEAGRAEHRSTHYVITFSGGTKNNPARSVTVEFKSEARLAVEAERAAHDKAEQEKRAEQDAALEQAEVNAYLANLTPQDVAAKIAEYFQKVYGEAGHNAADISAAWAMMENQQDDSEQVA